MSGWKDPKITEQRFHVKNAYGIWVADVGYKIIHQYGAGVDGKGKYLKVMFVPSEVRMLWGWDLDLTARVDAVSNLGTKENPLAGMVVTVQGRVRSPAVDYQTSGTYILKGDGSLQIVNRPKNLDATEDAVRNIGKLKERLQPLVGRAGEEARRLFSGR
ncbi:MAG: hypothetical protein CO113_01300 [Elusimicrobia bacterium CG_4_9_14_3_um_filter_62_55]|nr:MAG: hypothetical protein COR54_14785 [Elusimicrobia bacterium CG22_combo_CG10-13_8_21_14_all_63_91]PJA16946.1 MAG: hypothetical protein COX66_06160 [Elusimicrobia bacterium CG_4_10_14_0_2_um_filter_63_34]PJB26907.1 MAG: hypothetical protein CO113_01300 [Elusimicrobia bacterium CG_4_9_14_3_um_filter_62_55]